MSPECASSLLGLLSKAYLATKTPNEFDLVRLLWITLGFGDPLYGYPGPNTPKKGAR